MSSAACSLLRKFIGLLYLFYLFVIHTVESVKEVCRFSATVLHLYREIEASLFTVDDLRQRKEHVGSSLADR